MLLFLMAVIAASGSAQAEPVYVLEYPGIAFEWLPEEMNPPLEGTLDEEAGVITSNPNSDGIEYKIYYWREELEPNSRKADWISERFRDIISPDLMPSLFIGSVWWSEGSTESEYREYSSIGLVPYINFNKINETGGVLATGRACAVFTEGYSILIYGITPAESGSDAKETIEYLIARMYLVR
jgi:hypothetical protein